MVDGTTCTTYLTKSTSNCWQPNLTGFTAGGSAWATASKRIRELRLPATTGRSPHAPKPGRGEQLNDRFPAPSLGPSLT